MNVTTTAPTRAPENTYAAAWEAVKAQIVDKAHVLEFFVAGTPKGEDRVRATSIGGKARVHKSEKTVEARHEVLVAFQHKFPSWQAWTGPIRIDTIDCHDEPDDCWPGKHCTRKPDVDNSAKLVFDALKGHAWSDDVRAVLGVPAKTYFHTPGKWVRLSFYHPVGKPLHGRVKHPTVEGRTDLYEHGRLYGSTIKDGTRFHAVAYLPDPEDTEFLEDRHLFDESHKSRRWPSLTAAEAAIRKEVGL